MFRIRILTMVAALLSLATVTHAQSLSSASVRSLGATQNAPTVNERNFEIEPIPGTLRIVESVRSLPTPQELNQLEAQAEQLANQPFSIPTWFTQTIEQGMTTLQKLRSQANGVVGSASKKPCCEPVSGLTGVVQVAGRGEPGCKDIQIKVQPMPTGSWMCPANECTATMGWNLLFSNGNVIRHIAHQMPCSGLKDFVQSTCPVQTKAVQATPACCCKKACACCETCKAKPTAAAQVFPRSIPMAPVPVQNVMRAMTAVQAPLPRFESPDFEVHCEKMTHREDMVVFEGNVMLLSKKHAQPIRINAQRVALNLKDGSYTVESMRQVSTPVSSFGVMRTSVVECPMATCPVDTLMPAPSIPDMQHRIIRVVPVPMIAPTMPPASEVWRGLAAPFYKW